ncbi:hypothetical protein [Nitrosomonas ureae]|uniref:hypothetical protein n=1 Tax=Nitrosomonas ureae TaxID=44577 RepID=UPI001596A4EE|nr:hypothetical protein [Nitrosomonas ureae]
MEQDEIIALNSFENSIFAGALINKYTTVFIEKLPYETYQMNPKAQRGDLLLG